MSEHTRNLINKDDAALAEQLAEAEKEAER